MSYKRFERCLKEDEIELYVLQEKEWERNPAFTIHINRCDYCFEQYQKLLLFHQILDAELDKPISAQIVNLVEGIKNN